MATVDISAAQRAGAPSFPAGAGLQTHLQALAKRRNALTVVRSMIGNAIWGVGLASLSVALYKLQIIEDGPLWAPPVIIGASLLWGAFRGYSKRAGTFQAAVEADSTLGLSDRLGSALAFVAPEQIGANKAQIAPKNALEKAKFAVLGAPTSQKIAAPAHATQLVPALVNEAATRAGKLDGRVVYPFRFDRRAQVLLAASAIFLGLCFAPNYPILWSKEDVKAKPAIMAQGEKLQEIAKKIRKKEGPKNEEVKRLNARLEKLGLKMARGRLTKRAALTEVGELKKEMQKAQVKSKSESQNSGLPQIAEAMKDAPLQSKAGRKAQNSIAENKWDEAAKQLDELADKLDKGQLSQQEKEKAAKDLESVAKELRQRGGQANQEAAKKMEDAAEQLRQNSPQGGQKNPQSPQNQDQQNQGNKQNQQQNGQQGQQQQQKGQGQQQQQGQDGQQQGQKKEGQGQQQQSQNGQQKQGQKGQGQQQQGQQGQQQQNQQGQKGQQQQGQQGQQNQQGQGQKGQSQQSQQGQGKQGQGQQGKQGGQGQSPGGQEGQQSQGAGGSLRDMANSLRQGAGNGSGNQNLQDMLNQMEEAENGTNGGEQFGMGKPSEKGGLSRGDMKGMTPGKDLMPSDPHGKVGGGAGLGPRNNATGNNSGGGVSKTKSKRTGDMRRYQDVWSDRLAKTHSKIDKLKGKWGGNGEVEQLPTMGEGKGGEAHTPYYDVYESYKKDAEDAVSREAVPPSMKGPVKDYFESLKP